MKRKRLPPDDPREWIRRAKSNLVLSGAVHKDVDFADLCFDAQQAAEKAIKAVFIHRSVTFPLSHDLERLLRSLGRKWTPCSQICPRGEGVNAIRACDALSRPVGPGHAKNLSPRSAHRDGSVALGRAADWAALILSRSLCVGLMKEPSLESVDSGTVNSSGVIS